MVSARITPGRAAFVVAALALFALPASADVMECLESCRQQTCADREACEGLLNPQPLRAEAQAQQCATAFPVGSSNYRACMKRGLTSNSQSASADYRRCINLANTAGGACARSCAPSPNEPFPVPIPGPFMICP